MICLTLPWPPGVNNLYATVGKRRILSNGYRAWREEAGWLALAQRLPKVIGPYSLRIVLDRPDKRKTDLDGRAKAIIDLLVKIGLTSDDHLLQTLTLEWSDRPPAKPGAARITIQGA